MSYLESLKKSPVFYNVNEDYICFLLDQPNSILHLNKEDFLFQQGEMGESFYVLISGELKLFIIDRGTVIIEHAISESVSLGEMSVLTSEPRSASVKATKDSILFKFSAAMFNKHIAEENVEAFKISYNLLKIMASRLAITNQILSSAQRPSLSELEQFRHRLAKELLL